MPTILVAYGFEVRIMTNDHPPAHVHGFKAGRKAKIEIAGAAPVLVKTTMTKADTAHLLRLVAADLAQLQAEWRRIHGPLR
jgi:uncharacterized protein DUF4160